MSSKKMGAVRCEWGPFPNSREEPRPGCTARRLLRARLLRLRFARTRRSSRLLEDIHPLAVATGDLGDGGVARGFLGAEVNNGVPEGGAADGEADETRHGGRDREPLAHLLVVFAASEDDAADLVASTAAG